MTVPPAPSVPAARREDVVDVLHGVPVADPYRWLEDGASAEVRAWTAAQNARTEAILQHVPGREALEARLRELYLVGAVTTPAIRGERVFYLKRDGEQNQPVLSYRDGLEGVERVLVDPNALGEGGLIALDWWYPSLDGAFVAYGTSANGDEWSTLRVIEVATGRVLPDAIPRTRYSSVVWWPDNAGFFYTRYPQPGTVPPGQEHYNSHAFRHRLGDDPASDPKIFGAGRSPQDMIDLAGSADGRWLVAVAMQGWAKSEVYLRDLRAVDEQWVAVVEGEDALFVDPHFAWGRLFLRTNQHAPTYRIVAVDPARPEQSAWETVIPDRPERVIEGYVPAGIAIVTADLEAATSRLRRYDHDGTPAGDLPLPGLGSLAGLDGEPDNPTLLAGYTSFAVPASVLAFDVAAGAGRPLAAPAAAVGFDPAAMIVTQVRYPSKDGTLISMFLIHRRGLAPTGDVPTILAAYGGFNISKTPEYRPQLPGWLERGGLLAVPNLRGGGEYGEAWHQAGMLGNKQNVFDDFIAAAEYLIREGWTRPERLGIRGGSNGGLLVGAALTRRPDLYRAVFCAVPLLDMLRYHHFSIAKLWVPEYGSSEDAEQFAWLAAYSPYHHVTEATDYPAVLLTAAEQDSRVDPLHARKMTALLQWATADAADRDERPILLRLESEAGHGAGKPLRKRIEEAADEVAFWGWQLGVTWE